MSGSESSSVAVDEPSAGAADAEGIQLPLWTKALVALTFTGGRAEFRRALGASTIHDFCNWLALLIFFPIELIWHPLERISGALTNALRRDRRPHRGRAQVGHPRPPHHRLHRAARPGRHPGRRALNPMPLI
jgi:hypothetical protein